MGTRLAALGGPLGGVVIDDAQRKGAGMQARRHSFMIAACSDLGLSWILTEGIGGTKAGACKESMGYPMPCFLDSLATPPGNASGRRPSVAAQAISGRALSFCGPVATSKGSRGRREGGAAKGRVGGRDVVG